MPLISSQRERLAALAVARWQMFKHSLHSTRGKLELFSRTFVVLLFTVFALGGAIGNAIGAFYIVQHGNLELLALLLWPIFLFWQIFPVMASAFSENPDSSYLLRFPLSYRSYFLVRLFYGLLDPACFVAGAWLLGMLIGIGIAAPALLPATVIVLLTFALFNVLLTQMIFAWVEKWLLQRRTREILGGLLVLFFICFQFIGPLINHYGRRAKLEVDQIGGTVAATQQLFPPGASAHALVQIKNAQWISSLASYGVLLAYSAVVFWLLGLRFHAYYRGENLSEADSYKKSKSSEKKECMGWNLFGAPSAIAAVFEKEVRYLGRSGPLLFTLAVPLIMLLFFRVQGTARGVGFFGHSPNLIFPLGAAYALLLLTNLSYNTFGGDTGGGMQFFFAAPVRMRYVLIAKNLAHTLIFAADLLIIWIGVWLLYRRPLIPVTLLTVGAALFVLPIDFATGNMLSIYAPKKANPGKFRQQRASQWTVLVSFIMRGVLLGLVAIVVWLCNSYDVAWLAGIIFLLLTAGAIAIYAAHLNYAEDLALERREILIAELGRK